MTPSLSNYMQLQVKKIEIDKWCEGCRIEADPGPMYIMDWIEHNGQWFRSAYERSICKACRHWRHCGHHLRPSCTLFEND